MLDWEYHLERQKDLWREVERERLAVQVQQAQRQDGVFAGAVVLAAGRTMARLGAWLKALGKPANDYADEIG